MIFMIFMHLSAIFQFRITIGNGKLRSFDNQNWALLGNYFLGTINGCFDYCLLKLFLLLSILP